MYLVSQYIYTRKSKHSIRKTYQAILPVYSTENIFQKPVRSLFLDIRKKKKSGATNFLSCILPYFSCQNPYPSIRSEPGLLRVRGCVSIPNTLPQTLYLKVKVLVTQSCLTLCNTMDCSLPGSSVYGILEWQEYWSGLPFPS